MKTRIKKGLFGLVKWPVVVADMLLVAAFVMSAWGGAINPNTSVITAGLTLMFPILLGLMVIAVAVTAIWFRKLALVNLVALLLCSGQILDFCPLNFLRATEDEASRQDDDLLKVLSFNVYGFMVYGDSNHEDNNPTVDYILKSDADIVLLQEADGFMFNRVSNEQEPLLNRKYPYNSVTYRGMAIYSKYSFVEVPVAVKDKAQLDLCRYDVTLPDDRVVHFFNVHMQSIGLTAEDKQMYVNMTSGETIGDTDRIRRGLLSKLASAFRSRASQAHDVRSAIDSVDGDVILTGDFNDVPGSYDCLTAKGQDLKDAYRQSGLGPAITYHANRFYFRIDHMFYRGNIESVRTERGDCSTSDHYPLISTFKLQ